MPRNTTRSTPPAPSSSSSSSPLRRPRQQQQQKRDDERNHHRQLMAGRRRTKTSSSSSSSTSTISEAQSIQKSLQRTHGLLQNELQRVAHVTSAIRHDGELLEQTMHHHKSLHTKQAQHALTGLQRAQRREQYILLASVAWFALVALYVVWSRVLLRIDVLTPLLKLAWSFVVTAAGGGGSSEL
jgi:hypothetical protein